MPERNPGPGTPSVYSIAAHRGFADALVAGLLPRYAESDLGLARLTLLLPSQRAARTVTEAFVRISGQGGASGLLLPRMAIVGDLDLDETLGPLLDPLDAGDEIPPAADPVRRWLRLAEILRNVLGETAPHGAALLRQAEMLATTMDRLLVEGIAPVDLISAEVVGLVGEQAEHWQANVHIFLTVQAHWLAELTARGEVDGPTRRNRLFERAAKSWAANPPTHPIVAAGVTSASPALARLLRVVAETPRGAVILPDLDLALERGVWEELGTAGAPAGPEDPPFGRGDAVTHPQYHLKLLLNRMGVNRDEVRPWHRAGMAAAPPARSKAISSLFLPPFASASWADLPEGRRLAGVRLMESEHPGAEAQAIAVLMREALETPERRVALVTPDRALASRVVAHLRRWEIAADDTAGRPLSQTAAGRVLLLLAEIMAESAPPVPLVALLSHPLVGAGEGRALWLDRVRALDLALRGPRPAPGLEPLAAVAERGGPALALWWKEVAQTLAPLLAHREETPLADLLDTLATTAEALCGEALWGQADGRCLARLFDGLREPAREVGTRLHPRDCPALLRERMDAIAVRPPWGGHPRVAIYGLIEARMSRADLVICGGLTEGTWPGSPSPDPLLPPAVLRQLGVPGADFRIGLSAHDLAAALGAPEVVLSWSRRDESGPVIPSRFVLRVAAMLGEDLARAHTETEAPRLARTIDDAPRLDPHPRPEPCPSAEQRRVDISATNLDRLRSDPYQFYANAILRLSSLNALDAEPNAALRGEAVHRILDTWHRADGDVALLRRIAAEELDALSAHPLMRALWRPRLMQALEWIGAQIVAQRAAGRTVAGTELWGAMEFDGVRVHGRADRIDRLPDGTLAIVDYKTGQPPSNRMVQEGFSLQLGTLGLIAEHGRFADKAERIEVTGTPTRFEYWSLARDSARGKDAFGYWREPIMEGRRKTGIPREDFLAETARYLGEAIEAWIKGDAPFTARLNPDLGGFNDYDQLMRLDEWFWSLDRKPPREAAPTPAGNDNA